MTDLVVVTDSDLPADGVIVEILERAGFAVRREQCRTEADVIAAAAQAAGLLVQWAPIGERVIRALPELRAISRLGIGVDMVDTEAATRRGIAVANTPDYCIEEVALHATALAFNLLRGIISQDGAVRASRWEPVHGYSGARRPSATTIGVLGFGRIGRRVVAGCLAFGFKVIVHDVDTLNGEISATGARAVSWDELLTQSDLLTLHAPLTTETRGLVDRQALAKMKPGAFLVNTTRGGLVDEDALAAALESGHLGGAGLDVFADEPLPVDSPLRRLPGVILTPHCAWYSPHALAELPRRAAENLVALLTGDGTPTVLNPEYALYRPPGRLGAV